MKILIVNIYFHPDPTGTGLVLTELARDLVGYGHDVTVVTSVPHYGIAGDGRWQPANGRKGLSLWREEALDGMRVIRTAVYVPQRKTFWSRSLNYATFSLLAILAGLRCGHQDIILCTSPPLSLGISAWLLSRLKRAPFVFNVQDIYPDAAILMGMLRSPLLIALFRRLERFIYRQAALVTVISEGAKQNLARKGVPGEKIAVIPNWVDVEYVRPVPFENEFRRSLAFAHGSWWMAEGANEDESLLIGSSAVNNQPSTKIVMFAGNIGLIAGLETVLAAAAELRRRPDIQFVIVGEGNAKAALVERAERMGLSNVTFLPTQPREILPQMLGAADLHLVTLKLRMSTTSVPSKSYGIMASGRAMVAAVDPGSEVWRLVQAADAGVCIQPEEPLELARAVEALCDDPEQRRRLGENARAYVVRQNAKRELTALYSQVLGEVAATAMRLGRRVVGVRKHPRRQPQPVIVTPPTRLHPNGTGKEAPNGGPVPEETGDYAARAAAAGRINTNGASALPAETDATPGSPIQRDRDPREPWGDAEWHRRAGARSEGAPPRSGGPGQHAERGPARRGGPVEGPAPRSGRAAPSTPSPAREAGAE